MIDFSLTLHTDITGRRLIIIDTGIDRITVAAQVNSDCIPYQSYKITRDQMKEVIKELSYLIQIDEEKDK